MTYEEIVSLAEKNFKKTKAKKIESNAAVEFDIYGEGEGAFYVELKEGTDEAAIAFAKALAEEFGLVPEAKSKFARAMALAMS